ncbi:type IV secretory system conjugative DNA transfer family protein [uncultured Amphritea sp.]|uniref:type IV secretory system conjugative DNA transfer family protein n=1 Tax=uncultured Amphritea sp. TaxID=981605 RepID=UPI002613F8AC|nr:type IV secretory system conjugative DNA transfer family protein [uncultured Amphritea sp.]
MKPIAPFLIVSLALSISACSTSGKAELMNVPDASLLLAEQSAWKSDFSLESIQGLSSEGIKESIEKNIQTGDGSRFEALKTAAYDLGIKGGLYSRRKEINEMLRQSGSQLIRLFDFSSYMLPGNVFPPVITQTEGMINSNSRTEQRLVRHSYHMVTMPKLLISPPTYLNYLVRHYPAPELPNIVLLPVTEVERKNWKLWIAEAWKIGETQADKQYESDANRLQRDLQGIRLFHDLVARGVITMPRVAKQDYGVVLSKDGKNLTIGDEVISIIGDSHFTDSNKWAPIVQD